MDSRTTLSSATCFSIMLYVYAINALYIFLYAFHRLTGLEILGDPHESARLALKARKPLEESGGMLPGKF